MVNEVKDLVIDCMEGKRMAQRELYHLFAPKMLGICYRYTKSLEDAEDVLQEGFIKIFTRIKQYNGTGDFAAWISIIMVNSAIDYINKNKKYKNDLQITDVPLNAVSDENPEVYIDTKDLVEEIRRLPLMYQVVFNLIAVEGYNHSDVAELLKTNLNTVRSRYSRARAMLIVEINKNEELQLNYYAK